MTPTPALRARLRRDTDEVVPSGGTDADTRFADAEIDEILTEAESTSAAAAEGWTRKAMRALSERGGLQETSAGSERMKFVSIESYRDHCLAMAALFTAKGLGVVAGGSESLVFGIEQPDILGTASVVGTDVSRLALYVEV